MTDFDEWLAARIAEAGPFTILIVLVSIGELHVELLRSTHLHVLGDETSWAELAGLFESARVKWDGAAFFEAGDGLVPDPAAKRALSDLVGRLHAERLLLNEGQFFDRLGRRLRIDEVTPH